MLRSSVLVAALLLAACSRGDGLSSAEVARWSERASRVTIARDEWGIPHVKGVSDADAVFGMIYAQAEDDFPRIERNYLNALGRLAEAEGERAIWTDLRMRLFIEEDSLQAMYVASPEPMRVLMEAWADGLNYFLYSNPETEPLVLTHFEPWMALAFSEGSIGGDIESVSADGVRDLYGERVEYASNDDAARSRPPRAMSGSNGFAIAPSRSASGKSLLLINPHTSFFFREELQMTSDSGLNAYGAVTWGQFFVYQGFNATAGWMHTSSNNDAIDEFAVTVAQSDSGATYRHGDETRRVRARNVRIKYRTEAGMETRDFTVHATHHGPVVRAHDGKWVSVRLMHDPVKALTQSWTRTKARNLAEFKATMELHTNSSNNTVFADAEGNIAYFHANFVPRRDTRFDWSKPVDGNDPATEWRGIHSVDESPNVINPSTGWIQNTNNWPYSAAGSASPRKRDFARYFEDGEGENARGLHAIEVLTRESRFDLDKLIAAAYDPHLTAFDALVPALVRDWDALPSSDARKAALAEPVALLRAWDRRSSTTSEATTLAVFFGEDLWTRAQADPEAEGTTIGTYIARPGGGALRIAALQSAVAKLTADFGSWKVQWGEVNRFQRLTGDIQQPFADSGASTPVGFTSARWGSLAAFQARTYPGTKRMYGTSGNSFVAVVEFGDPVRARAVTAGGLNNVPGSKHFNDQAARYATGALRDVHFTRAQLEPHIEREYRPGERPR